MPPSESSLRCTLLPLLCLPLLALAFGPPFGAKDKLEKTQIRSGLVPKPSAMRELTIEGPVVVEVTQGPVPGGEGCRGRGVFLEEPLLVLF